jgi:hypothetical protein
MRWLLLFAILGWVAVIAFGGSCIWFSHAVEAETGYRTWRTQQGGVFLIALGLVGLGRTIVLAIMRVVKSNRADPADPGAA